MLYTQVVFNKATKSKNIMDLLMLDKQLKCTQIYSKFDFSGFFTLFSLSKTLFSEVQIIEVTILTCRRYPLIAVEREGKREKSGKKISTEIVSH